jgi:hypothetical protein
MYSEEDLVSAVQAGVLSEEGARAFRAHVAQLRKTPMADEEHFRLVTGFNDVFVVIACALLLSAVTWIGMEMKAWAGPALLAATAWVLAEFFTRKRRMALPSIVLLLAFVGGTMATAALLWWKDLASPQWTVPGAVGALAAWLHWLRFKVPITVAAGAAAVVTACIALLGAVLPQPKEWTNVLWFAAGIAVFAIAMRWDASDTRRETRRSDIAFWLHLVAAPLLVHPMFVSLKVFGGATSTPQALVVVGLYVLLALVSLSIDRRALMVSALVYVLYAFSALLKLYGVVSLSFALTALVIGSALLMLSAFWHPSRAAVLRAFPESLRAHLAPLR